LITILQDDEMLLEDAWRREIRTREVGKIPAVSGVQKKFSKRSPRNQRAEDSIQFRVVREIQIVSHFDFSESELHYYRYYCWLLFVSHLDFRFLFCFPLQVPLHLCHL